MKYLAAVLLVLNSIIFSQNLIQNPSCEDALVNGEIPHWTEEAGTTWTRSDNHPAYTGTYYFWAAASSPAVLTQTVDVSAYAAGIDKGLQEFYFTARVKSYDQTPTDKSQITIEYLDASNGVLYTFDSGEHDNVVYWEIIEHSKDAPIGTRSIKISLTSIRNSGTNNDGYFDTLSLIAYDIPPFTEYIPFETTIFRGSSDWGDYDNDGWLDLLITGYTASFTPITELYWNIAGGFIQSGMTIPDVMDSSVDWGDYDNDGDLDIMISGDEGASNISTVLRNNRGSFTDINAGLNYGLTFGSGKWGDYDNDGDLDMLITGNSDLDGVISRIYRNDSGNFTDIEAGLPGVQYSTVDWTDYDNDGDMDIFISGQTSDSILTAIFNNDNGYFNDINAGFTKLHSSNSDWGDYDNDGDQDLLLTGYTGSESKLLLYTNDGGVFVESEPTTLDVDGVRAIWGDYDNDGDLDMLVVGDTSQGEITKVFKNDSGSFSDIGAGLTGVRVPSGPDWVDFDKDGDLDIFVSGFGGKVFIFKNNALVSNSRPAVPFVISTSCIGNSATLSWDKSIDAQTPQDGLSYNLRIGTSSNGIEVMAPLSNVSSGFREVVDTGNAGQNTSWTINGLAPGTYYWSVQAIDHCYEGSWFSQIRSFTILGTPLNITTTVSGSDIMISWDPVSGATSYKVYSSDDPYSGFIEEAIVPTGETWSTPYSESKKFYYVVAVAE
jgi:hypothetical protein